MENGTRLYPQSTSNPNVPEDTFLIAEVTTMSGEINTTYYATREGDMFSVGDWSVDRPHPVYMNQLWKLTGDTPNMIESQWQSYFRR